MFSMTIKLTFLRHLTPDRLLLQCPNLESVHASDCEDIMVKTIEAQVSSRTEILSANLSVHKFLFFKIGKKLRLYYSDD